MTTEHDEELHARLQDEHLAQLRASGIADEVMLERGYRSAPSSRYRKALGFRGPKTRPGLLLPLWTVDGAVAYCILRPDEPRRNRDGKPIKYETPAGAAMRLDCPPRCREGLGDPAVPLWITEGQKKADALASRDQCAIALLGVWNWRGKNALGGTTVLADWEYVHLKGRDVRLAFDSDVVTKEQVQKALARLAGF
ncbi:MAG: DUF3854 domain-containing protein, partial [Chloroflexi bacterium]|nr:DUF3854 domain-containing protein [Chloroflexota bacterium]